MTHGVMEYPQTPVLKHCMRWYYDAAIKGDMNAQRALIKEYDYEDRTDYSFEWRLFMAENGDIRSMYEVGYRYLHGIGTEIDDNDGIYWLEKCSGYEDDINSKLALHELAKCYAIGYGVNKDITRSYKLYKKLFEMGYEMAYSCDIFSRLRTEPIIRKMICNEYVEKKKLKRKCEELENELEVITNNYNKKPKRRRSI